MLNPGLAAPDFELPDARMEMVRLGDFRGHHHVVLYFFNRDHSPGGVIEAVEFSDRTAIFREHGAIVLGVSLDDCMAHEVFSDEEGIEFDLLSDPEGEVSRLYHALKEREVQGMVKLGVERSTFVIDKEGVIRHAFYHVQPKGHAAEVLSLVKQLGKS
ncbi:peroxiredoxin Q/BCP [Andreprevotia lacus DSM 23236]|jgi:peroxiredoxin Q/BCP|uniref:thioredoxin-dependent peroxiredoxin n=1 Tax=Andreprevotia lacus DSM 23236 TaxID=1121001 RepID=A0A1W1XQB2_9NEIS|nr:peroxiredoxin [Andreprevotia lacus]SMC25701.1 peroxiredoxin Q/BCP [Andreprevotia lacus DSM 23236]